MFLKSAIALALFTVCCFADSTVAEDKWIRKTYARYADHADALAAEAKVMQERWEKICLARKLVIGFDQLNRPGCKPPEPPKPEPVKTETTKPEAPKPEPAKSKEK